VGHFAIDELHDADRIRRPPVIREDEFRDPEVACADDTADTEVFQVWLGLARRSDVVSAPDALSRLRIFEQRVFPVYFVLEIEIAFVRGGPVSIERLANIVLTHPVTSRS
jgi:hypothetical protein